MQRIFYEQAARELIEEVKGRFTSGASFNKEARPFKNLFLLNGTKIESLLDIPEDTIILIVSSDDFLHGVKFDKVPPGLQQTSSDKNLISKLVNAQHQ